MACDHITVGGIGMIVCGRPRGRPRARKCCSCKSTSQFQCDWKVGKAKTCDKYLCRTHAKEVAPEKHLCPEHQKAYDQWKNQQASKVSA